MTYVFRCLSIRWVAAHKTRALLTLFGIVLAVAAWVAIRLLSVSAALSYHQTVDGLRLGADLTITNGEQGVDENLLAVVADMAGVRSASGVVVGTMPVVAGGHGALQVIGIDLLADAQEDTAQVLETENDDSLAFISGADSIAVTEDLLRQTGRKLGDSLRVRAPFGETTLTIRKVFRLRQPKAEVSGRLLAIMDLPIAQRFFGLDGRLSRIDIMLTDRSAAESIRDRLARVIGAAGSAGQPADPAQAFDEILVGIDRAASLAGLVGLVSAFLLIFNTMTIAVAERRGDLAVLRALGCRRGEVVRLILMEALVFGAVGATLGVPLGRMIAAQGLPLFLSIVGRRSLAGTIPSAQIPALSMTDGAGALVSLATALGGAAVAAWAAARVPPMEAFRRARRIPVPDRASTWAMAAGGLLAALAFAAWYRGDALPLPDLGPAVVTVGFLMGGALVTPALTKYLLRALDHVIGTGNGVSALFAVRWLLDRAPRVGVTAAALGVSLGGAVTVSTMHASLDRTFRAFVDAAYSDIDVLVSADPMPLQIAVTPMPTPVEARLAAQPSVARVTRTLSRRVTYNGTAVGLIASDTPFPATASDWQRVVAVGSLPMSRVAGGDAIFVSDVFARRFARGVGDWLSLDTRQGPVDLQIAGVYFDLAFDSLGAIRMDAALYRRLWEDASFTAYGIVAAPGVDPVILADDLRDALDGVPVHVFTIAGLRRAALAEVREQMLQAYPVIGVAIVIALFGLGTTLLTSILDQGQEIALLRIAGGTAAQVSGACLLQGLVVGALATVLALLLGGLVGYVEVDVVFRWLLRHTIYYAFPCAGALAIAVGGPLLAIAAGWLPARRAAGVALRETLRAES